MSEELLMNDPQARTPEGTIKEPPTPPTDPSATPTEPKTPEPPKDPKAQTAPEKYEGFKVPEGQKFEGEQLESASKLFKELGLSQENAQKLVDFHFGQLKAISDGIEASMNETHNAWKTELEADADIAKIGGDKIRENLGRALDLLGNKELANNFKQLMNLTGVGDNLAFVKVINQFAERLIEPRHVQGDAPAKPGQTPSGAASRPSAAKAMYPNLPG